MASKAKHGGHKESVGIERMFDDIGLPTIHDRPPRSPIKKPAIQSITSDELLLRLPRTGKLARCNEDGFAFIHSQHSDFFVHIHDNVGKPLTSMAGNNGRLCAYVVGGHAFRYAKGKPDWSSSPVKWMFVEDIGDGVNESNFNIRRQQALRSLSRAALINVLTADWYCQIWERDARKPPEAPLKAEEDLNDVVHDELVNSADLGQLLELLESVLRSPWYGRTRGADNPALAKAVKPHEWPLKMFINSRRELNYEGVSNSLELYGEMFKRRIEQARAVSIDLEGDRDKVFQYGWKNALGSDLRENREGLTDAELGAAFKESILAPNEALLIGHNIINWDLPVLQAHGVIPANDTRTWDSLLAAWLLEPWKSSHALIVAEDAHRADADAAVAFELAEKQIALFTRWMGCRPDSIHGVVDHLFKHPEVFAGVSERAYPSIQPEYAGKTVLIPSERLREFNWRSGYCLHRETVLNRAVDPVLQADICTRVAEQGNSIETKMISVIVGDAARNGVLVRLSMIPIWLMGDELANVLRTAHADSRPETAENNALIRLTVDLFALYQEDALGVLADPHLIIPFPDAVIADWQRAYEKVLTSEDVDKKFPGIIEKTSKRSLYPVADYTGDIRWLLYEPGGVTDKTPHWSLLPKMPPIAPSGNIGCDFSVMLPRWREGAALNLDVDRLFVSPDTANRSLYLADMVHIVLNLVRSVPDDTVLIIAMRSASEADDLQKSLVRLSLAPQHSSSPLRQLERVRKEGLRVQVCAIEHLPAYLDAADKDRLNIKVQVAVSEIPLHRWHAMLHAPDPGKATAEIVAEIIETGSEEGEDDEGVDEGEGGATAGVDEDRVTSLAGSPLSASDIHRCLGVFLNAWVCFITQRDSGYFKYVMVFDQRLSSSRAAKLPCIKSIDVGFYELKELLGKNKLEIYNQVCFPKREEKEIPSSYEEYQRFLKSHWRYDVFRPGTQQPAINALLADRRDMLLRLPTGEGKSIVFHLPALLRGSYSGKLTVVITPLRALMQDQVQGLWRRLFVESVDFLSGGREAWVNHEVYQGVLDGRIKLLFAAPERFRIPRFIDALERRRQMDGGLEFVVFDEVHCVSQWGFEFRPDYLYAAQYVSDWFKNKVLPGNPHRILLTSATVTKSNQESLERELQLNRGEYHDLPENMPHPIQDFIRLESFNIPAVDRMEKAEIRLRKIEEIITGIDLKQSAVVIFVKRRADCHGICDALNARASLRDSGIADLIALPFHAGLPEVVKTDAIELLKANTVNVLVCTKAFGMGMDIPHLHACIHYEPPTFIEDYLQEVGRIGRDQGVREKAKLKEVVGSLIYDQGDLERNLSRLINNTVQPSDLQDFFSYCYNEAPKCEQLGELVCFVNSTVLLHQDKKFTENQVSSSLFWLERMKVLKLEGRYPPFLQLTLNIPMLRQTAGSSTFGQRLAAAILSSVDESSRLLTQLGPANDDEQNHSEQIGEEAEDHPARKGGFRSFLKGLLRGLVSLISAPTAGGVKSTATDASPFSAPKQIVAAQIRDPMKIEACIPIDQLMTDLCIVHMDDLYKGLHELSNARVLSVNKNFLIKKSRRQRRPEFWDLLQCTVDTLVAGTSGMLKVVGRAEIQLKLSKWYLKRLIDADRASQKEELTKGQLDQIEKIAERDSFLALKTALIIVRFSGMEVKEKHSPEGESQYVWTVPETSHAEFKRTAMSGIATLRSAIAWLAQVDPSGENGDPVDFQVELFEFMKVVSSSVRMSELKRVVTLIESSGFFTLADSNDGWSSIVTIYRRDALPAYIAESSDAPPEVTFVDANDALIHSTYKEMIEKFELQKLRAQCMQLLALMPEENRKAFIDQYFQATGCENHKTLIEKTIGDIDVAMLAENPALTELLSHVRQERFEKEMIGLNDEQRSVCTASYANKILVNAGPGSGKTHVLMMRCAYLIHRYNLNPSEILVLAFNRAVVAEIRERIRDLFRALGYGSYVNRLDVYTFHSFALKYEKDKGLYEEDAIGKAVHNFASRIWDEPEFASEVAIGYKAVLVDEYQDMNEDFYHVVHRLAENCSGGTMVIGDDDQDILTWNRRAWWKTHNSECPLAAIDYFERFKNTFKPEEYALKLNYRSGKEIVERAENMIKTVSGHIGFPRMKNDLALGAYRDIPGLVSEFRKADDCLPLTKDAFVYLSAPDQVNDRKGRGASVAILCRSNSECRYWSKMFEQASESELPKVETLGSEDFGLYQMRSVGAIQDLCRRRGGHEFVEGYTWKGLIEEYRALMHADTEKQIHYLDNIYELTAREKGRPRMRDLVSFIQEMRVSDVDRLMSKHGQRNNSNRLLVSTIHKVKGLEFDAVIIVPSRESFPFMAGDNAEIDDVDCAEEARLYYVAMTRARNRLYMGKGRHEAAWYNKKAYSGAHVDGPMRVLNGNLKDIYISWPAKTENVDNGVQDYLAKQVEVGDTLSFNKNSLFHNKREIGVLSRDANAARKQVIRERMPLPHVQVGNVIRYTCGPYFREHNPRYWNELHPDVREQCWFLTVIPEEIP